MLVLANRRIVSGAIWLPELTPWNPGHKTPVRLRSVEIESIVQVDPHLEAELVRREETPEPHAEERDHRRVGVREAHLAVSLGTLAGVEGRSAGEESLLGQRPDPLDPVAVHRFDLGELREVERVRCNE
ncbi:MAG TPA: hypothetical protein VFF40_06495 [Acidimicrobiia bacterium]|nr:hypothetical protein [Acidimicrobiia bacterium]